MRKIFLAIALLATVICATATTDVQVSGSGQTSVSAATPGSSVLLAHILRRRRVG